MRRIATRLCGRDGAGGERPDDLGANGMIKAILFDLGGTLFDFARMDTRADRLAAGRCE